jgi:hypothetical protein
MTGTRNLVGAVVAVALAACTGKASSSPTPPSTGGYPPLTDKDLEGHVEALNAMESIVDALLATSTQPSAQALAVALAKAPHVLRTGVAQGERTSAWVELAPGQVTAIVEVGPDPFPATTTLPTGELPPLPAPAALSAPRASALASATAPTFVLMTDGRAIHNEDIKKILTDKGYQGWNVAPTLKNLRLVGSQNILYLGGHGGVVTEDQCYEPGTKNVPPCYSVMTVEPVPVTSIADWPAAIRQDLEARRIDYLLDLSTRTKKFGITANFVRTYFRFKDNSLFMLEACLSANVDRATSWLSAFNDVNLATFVGWEGLVASPDASESALLFFDRLVGANSVQPILDPPTRPFDPEGVRKSLGAKIATYYDPGNGEPPVKAYMKIPPRPTAPFVGAPSIGTVSTDARKKQATAVGMFGKDPGASRRTVKVSGAEVPVVSWSEQAIVAELPPGDGGDFLISVDGVDSNPVQLTEWRATFTQELNMWFAFDPTDVTNATGTFTIRFRADVHDYREQAGEAPIQQVLVPFEIEEGSTLEGNGTATFNGVTTPFSGNTSLLGRLDYSSTKGWLNAQTWPFPPNTDFLDGLGWIDVSARKLYLFLYGAIGGGIRSYGVDLGLETAGPPTNCNLFYQPVNGATYLVLDLGDSFTVASGTCDWEIPCIFGADCKTPIVQKDKLTWQFVTAAPPDLQAPR